MKVKVLKRHVQRAIKFGGYYDGEHCPIALAIKEKQHKTVLVGYWGVDIGKNKDTPTPTKETLEFMEHFDNKRYHKLKTPFIAEFK